MKVGAILDYRNAKFALEQMAEGERGFKTLTENPHLGELLARMLRAQDVADISGADAVAAIAEARNQNEEDE